MNEGVRRLRRKERVRNHRFVKCWPQGCILGNQLRARGTDRSEKSRSYHWRGKPSRISRILIVCVLTNGDDELSAAEVQELLL